MNRLEALSFAYASCEAHEKEYEKQKEKSSMPDFWERRRAEAAEAKKIIGDIMMEWKP